jgi:hypothetical protein
MHSRLMAFAMMLSFSCSPFIRCMRGRRSARDDPDRINHASPSNRAVSQQVRVQPLESPVSRNSRLKPFGRGEQSHPQVLRYVDYAPVDLYPAVADAEHQLAGDQPLHIDVVRYL